MSTPESISSSLLAVAIHQLLIDNAKPIDELIQRRNVLTLPAKDLALSVELFRIRTEGGGLELLRPRLRASERDDLITRLDQIEAQDSGFSPGWWKCQWEDLCQPIQAERLQRIADDLTNKLISAEDARDQVNEALKDITASTNGTSPKHCIHRLTDQDALHVSETEWVISDIIPADGLTVVYGEPGSGKSFVLLDWLMAIATGSMWMDRLTTQGNVLYFVGEGQEGFKKRIIASKLDRHQNVPGFFWYRDQLDLTCEADLNLILKEVEALKPVAIVFDTLSHYRGGIEENSATEMGPVIKAVDSIKRICGSAVLMGHHPPKYDNQVLRGSSALLGAADCAIHVQGDGKVVKLTCKKMKDAEISKPIVVSLTKKEWMHEDIGVPLDSLQVTPCSTGEAMSAMGDNRLQRLEDYMRVNSGKQFSARSLEKGAQIHHGDVPGLVDMLVGRGLVRPMRGRNGTVWVFDTACTENLR